MSQPSSTIRLLLVEDNPGDAVLIQEYLRLADAAAGTACEVTPAVSVGLAAQLLRQNRFDVILLDLSLPDSHGLTTVGYVNGLAPETAIIVLTGLEDATVDVQAVRQGAQDYLVKNRLGPDVLVRSIRYALERKAIARRLKRAEQALQAGNDQLERKIEGRSSELKMVVSALQNEVRQRQSAEAELRRANHALRTVKACMEAIIHLADEQDLLEEICRIVIEVGGYRMAWVGYAQDDEPKSIRAVAHVGKDSGYLEQAQFCWADTALGRGPTGAAIRTGKPVIGRNFLSDPELAPWREEATKRGFQSSMALPLLRDGQAFGALTVYAAKADAFDPTHVELLSELADDLSFGIITLRLQAGRENS